jgi:hypothetical protein
MSKMDVDRKGGPLTREARAKDRHNEAGVVPATIDLSSKKGNPLTRVARAKDRDCSDSGLKESGVSAPKPSYL